MDGTQPAHDVPGYRLNVLRGLLLVCYTTESLYRLFLCAESAELGALRFYLQPDDGLRKMIDKVLAFCGERSLLPTLLAEVERQHSKVYPFFGAQILATRQSRLASIGAFLALLTLILGCTWGAGVVATAGSYRAQEAYRVAHPTDSNAQSDPFPSFFPTLDVELPTAAVEQPTQAAPTPLPSLPPTVELDTPTPAPLSVEQALRHYYSLIYEGDYESAWPMSAHFNKTIMHISTISRFASEWEKSGYADLQYIDVRQNNGVTAVVILYLRYPKLQETHQIRYTLKRDLTKGNERFGYWIFTGGRVLD